MEITQANFTEVARAGYTNPDCRTESEFLEDLARVNHIIRSLNKAKLKSFNIQLLVNQMITMCNVFKPDVAVKLISFKIEDDADLQTTFEGLLWGMGFPVTTEWEQICNITRQRVQELLNG